MDDAKGWRDAFKDAISGKRITHLDALIERFNAKGLLQEHVVGYIKALEQFSPDSNCGRWYKDAYFGILKAGTECDPSRCGPIDAFGHYGSENTSASRCFIDIGGAAGGTVALNFHEFAVALSKRCQELASTSKNCKEDC